MRISEPRGMRWMLGIVGVASSSLLIVMLFATKGTSGSISRATLIPGEHFALGSSVTIPAVVQRLHITQGVFLESDEPNTIQTQATEFTPESIKVDEASIAQMLENSTYVMEWLEPLESPTLAFRVTHLDESEFVVHPDSGPGWVSYFTDHEPTGDRQYGVSFLNHSPRVIQAGDLRGHVGTSNDSVELSVEPGGEGFQVVARIEEDGSLLLFSARVD